MYLINLDFLRRGRKVLINIAIFNFVLILILFTLGFINDFLVSRTDKSVVTNVAEVKKDGSDYEITYYFRYNNKQYTCYGGISRSYPEIKDTTVWFKSSNPEKCVAGTQRSFFRLFAVIGLIPLISNLFIIVFYIKLNKRIKFVNENVNKWKLVKGLDFKVDKLSFLYFNKLIKRPIVVYEPFEGNKITLKGDFRFDFIDMSKYNKIDLLIDENIPSNYYMDFNINRINKIESSNDTYE